MFTRSANDDVASTSCDVDNVLCGRLIIYDNTDSDTGDTRNSAKRTRDDFADSGDVMSEERHNTKRQKSTSGACSGRKQNNAISRCSLRLIRTATISHPANDCLIRTATISHPANDCLIRTATISHPANDCLIRTATVSHPANDCLIRTATISHPCLHILFCDVCISAYIKYPICQRGTSIRTRQTDTGSTVIGANTNLPNDTSSVDSSDLSTASVMSDELIRHQPIPDTHPLVRVRFFLRRVFKCSGCGGDDRITSSNTIVVSCRLVKMMTICVS